MDAGNTGFKGRAFLYTENRLMLIKLISNTEFIQRLQQEPDAGFVLWPMLIVAELVMLCFQIVIVCLMDDFTTFREWIA